MPNIDVSDLMSDPDFCEQVVLRRTTQTVNSSGYNTLGETDSTITAIVMPLDPSFLRDPELQNAKGSITVHSSTRLYDVVAGYNPDIIVWLGANYVVKKAGNWSQFGRGFTANICILLDTALSQ
jgi:hypothetical protein